MHCCNINKSRGGGIFFGSPGIDYKIVSSCIFRSFHERDRNHYDYLPAALGSEPVSRNKLKRLKWAADGDGTMPSVNRALLAKCG